MKRAALFAENAMNAGIEMINEGVRECDVAAKILHTQISGTEEFGGDYPSIMPLMPSGEKTSTPHLTWTDARYKNNERSEEHTSELQSRENLVCRLLLE